MFIPQLALLAMLSTPDWSMVPTPMCWGVWTMKEDATRFKAALQADEPAQLETAAVQIAKDYTTCGDNASWISSGGSSLYYALAHRAYQTASIAAHTLNAPDRAAGYDRLSMQMPHLTRQAGSCIRAVTNVTSPTTGDSVPYVIVQCGSSGTVYPL